MIDREPYNARMSSPPRHRVDPQHRRTFTPPRPRRARRPLGWPPPDWRTGIVAGLARVFVALVFAATPTLERRFAGASASLVSLALAAFVGSIAYVAWKMQSARSAVLLTTDVAALALLIPTVVIASAINVADAERGGQRGYVVLAGLAVLCVLGIVALVAATLGYTQPALPALALLPAVLGIATVLGSGGRFAGNDLARGLSAAWIVSGLLTFVTWLVRQPLRPLMAPGGFAAFTSLIIVVGATSGNRASADATNVGIAYIIIALAGAMLLLAARLAGRIAREQEAGPELAPLPPSPSRR